MADGFHGRLLRVDLGTGTSEELVVPAEWYRRFLGGSGLAARLLFDELERGRGRDPCAAESTICVVAGLLTGLPVAAACKLSVCGRSPLTGIWNEATAGGHFPAGLRATGFDGLLLTGEAPSPAYLLLDGRRAELCDAGDLWGLDTFAVEEQLAERHGPGARVACIGPAGERQVRFAALMLDGRSARAAGRGGMGAVFGAKRLKAIVVRGKERPAVHDPAGLRALLGEQAEPLRALVPSLHDFGTGGGVEAVEFWGDLPIRNWQLGSWKEGAKKTCAQHYLPLTLERHHACHACPLRCSKLVRLQEGPYAGLHGHGPEYETIAGFGSNCENDDFSVIMAANDYCNRMGLDTISASALVAFAMEAGERGLLTPADTAGLPLAWGDPATILGLLELTAERRAIGDLLAEGVRRAAARLGNNAEELAVHTKGMEYPLHDPRAFTSMAVHYATANRGACHLDGLTYFVGRGVPVPDLGYTEPQEPADEAGKALRAGEMQNYLNLFNPLGLCKFLFLARVGPRLISRWLQLATGWETSPEELLQAGERQVQLKRLINVRLGISRKDDTLPPRLLSHARPDGRSAGQLPHLGAQLNEYYRLRGWTPEGIPTPATLERHGLAELADGLPVGWGRAAP
ncbi:MAG: aldehyde ferredoxin oxidoreductase family protein [Deltaproteobacteria bacterium]|nr:aldehyde ferredoxin oxidoreductase family protein [Deltaproteobacteria bacterium]